MSFIENRRPILIALVAITAVVVLQLNRRVPDLDTDRAERQVRTLLQQARQDGGRVDLIAVDGSPVLAPAKVLGAARAISCRLRGKSGGRFLKETRYSNTRPSFSAIYTCLFHVEGPDDLTFRLGMLATFTNDRSARTQNRGFTFRLLDSLRTREFLPPDGTSRQYSEAEQQALWDQLAAHDIYVPADKTRPSLIDRAMLQHLKNITSD